MFGCKVDLSKYLNGEVVTEEEDVPQPTRDLLSVPESTSANDSIPKIQMNEQTDTQSQSEPPGRSSLSHVSTGWCSKP